VTSSQRRGDVGGDGSQLVVADPYVKQVAQHVDAGGVARRTAAERMERGDQRRPCGGQVESERNSVGFTSSRGESFLGSERSFHRRYLAESAETLLWPRFSGNLHLTRVFRFSAVASLSRFPRRG
jgi:hypothetical protein